MKRPTLIATEEQENQSVLIVDRINLFGSAVSNYLRSSFPAANTLEVVGWGRVPKIPNALYSHIVLFITGREDIKLVDEFLKKAKKDTAKLYFVAQKDNNYISELSAKITSDPNAHLILYGEVFGKDILFHPEFSIHRLFHQAATTQKLSVSGMGMGKIYPVHRDDFVAAVGECLFREEKGTYLLYPQNSPTELSTATIFVKSDPALTIDFVGKEEGREAALWTGTHVISDEYPIQERIREEKGLYADVSGNKTVHKQKDSPDFGKVKMGRKIPLLFIGLLLMSLLVVLLSFLAGLGLLQGSKYSLQRGNIAHAKSSILLARSLFGVSQHTVLVVFPALQEDVGFLREGLLGVGYVLDSALNLESVVYGRSPNPQADFTEGINNAKHAIITYQKLQAEHAQRKKSSPLLGNPILDNALTTTGSFDFLTLLFQNTADSLPKVVGMDQEKKYLVLFQNNMELRPGGGFIGSYGLLSLNKGRIEKFSIHDVYDADGQLKAHIEPPFAIRRYLPSVHWYLRDSNFNVDFSKSASASAYFLKEETGEVVDGVIGVDTDFIKNILEIIGPLYVSDYSETVHVGNFIELTQQHAQKDFFPGSTQKKDFLRSLFNALNQEVIAKKKISYFSLIGALNKSIGEKHVLFAFSDPNIQSVFDASNVSSTLTDNRVEGEDVVNDFLGISEANLGVNKVNNFIKRKISHHIGISDEGLVSSQVALMYKNTADNNPALNYKAYVRLVVPLGSQLSEITIDNESQEIIPAVTDPRVYENKNFVKPEGLEVETYEQEGKTVFGFLITVPQGKLQTIVVRYNLLKFFPLDAPISRYSYKHLKQPGTEGSLFSFSFEHPALLKVMSKPDFVQTDKSLRFETELKKDILFDMQFTVGQK